MLTSLTIKNIVLIEQLTINFESGLCTLTGETGAGKSILLDSLGLTLGARANTGLIRKGAEKASVTTVFELDSSHPVLDYIKGQDLDVEPTLILRRTLTSAGVSKCFINDQIISLSLMQKIANMLAEVHGQFDNQKLFETKNHIQYLDEYGAYNKNIEKTRIFWGILQNAQREMDELKIKSQTIHDEEKYLRESLHDLDALNVEVGESDKLESLKQKMKNAVSIIENSNNASEKLNEIQSISADIWRDLQAIPQGNEAAISAFERVNAEIEETFQEIQNLMSDLDSNNQSLEDIDERLFNMKTQARKHECEIDALPAVRDNLAHQLNQIENIEDLYAQSIKTFEKAKSNFYHESLLLHKKRINTAKNLQVKVMKELPSLKLEKARFKINVKEVTSETWGSNGIDAVEFLVATNPNADAGALNKIASGGELARLTLALKVVFADMGHITTMIFDEVDSGIGGATAAAVGDRLSKLSKHKQILVVTHSPQVAAKADNQWIVSKSGDKNVKTNIEKLNSLKERQEEIARMLSGEEITEEARAAASKLLEKMAA